MARENRGTRDNIYKRGNRWYIRFWHNGQEIRRSAGTTKHNAQVLLAQLRKDAERENVGLPKQSRMTFREWSERFMAERTALRSYRRDEWCMVQLVQRFGRLRLLEITRARVEAFQRDEHERGLANATVNRSVALLRRALNRAVELGEIEFNPIAKIKQLREAAPRLPTLSFEEERQLLEQLDDTAGFVVQLALETAARLGEMMALTWRNIDLDAATMTIEDSKSGSGRVVPLSPTAIETLRPRRALPAANVVIGIKGKPIRGHAVTQRTRRAFREMGREDLRFHDLRHVAASRLLAAGASLPEVAAMLGHKTMIIAARYAHPNADRMRELVARIRAKSER